MTDNTSHTPEYDEPECLSGADARMAADGASSGTFAYVEHTDGTWAPMMKQPDGTWACGQDTDHRAHAHRLDGDRIVLVDSRAAAEVAGVCLPPGSQTGAEADQEPPC